MDTDEGKPLDSSSSSFLKQSAAEGKAADTSLSSSSSLTVSAVQGKAADTDEGKPGDSFYIIIIP